MTSDSQADVTEVSQPEEGVPPVSRGLSRALSEWTAAFPDRREEIAFCLASSLEALREQAPRTEVEDSGTTTASC